MTTLEQDTQVQYLHGGKWQKGVVYGVRKYENEQGIVSKLTYLVDTGKHVGEATGVFRQPEQIEIDQEFVKVAD